MSAVLVFFAVPQEAKPFRAAISNRDDVKVIVSGMGQRNAERSARAAFDREGAPPRAVFTCGFAGALDPALRVGDVVFQTDDQSLSDKLAKAGARPATFHCAPKVIVTAKDKAAAYASCGAHAVEMESAIIAKLCADEGIPCAIVRSISDVADEDLPLDFNKLMTNDAKLSSVRLAIEIATHPHRIPALMRLGRNSALAADRLAKVLAATI